MKRGPSPGRPGGDRSHGEKAAEAWTPLPEWVAALAAAADREGLHGTGKRVGYSASAISAVINARYAGDLGRVEQAVRGALLGHVVDCPVLGDLARNDCLAWQKKPFAATSSVRVAVYRACRAGCPNAEKKSD